MRKIIFLFSASLILISSSSYASIFYDDFSSGNYGEDGTTLIGKANSSIEWNGGATWQQSAGAPFPNFVKAGSATTNYGLYNGSDPTGEITRTFDIQMTSVTKCEFTLREAGAAANLSFLGAVTLKAGNAIAVTIGFRTDSSGFPILCAYDGTTRVDLTTALTPDQDYVVTVSDVNFASDTYDVSVAGFGEMAKDNIAFMNNVDYFDRFGLYGYTEAGYMGVNKVDIQGVPEPSMVSMFLLSMPVLGGLGWRRFKKKA